MNNHNLDAIFIARRMTIKQAMQKFNSTDKGVLLVTDKKRKLIGTVTSGDLRRGIVNGIRFDDCVEKIMHKNFVTVMDDIPNLKKVARKKMIETMVEKIPVVNDKGIVVDLITLD
jgi:CBS-domain-containing membrane protein